MTSGVSSTLVSFVDTPIEAVASDVRDEASDCVSKELLEPIVQGIVLGMWQQSE